MATKQIHYNIDNISQYNALINLIFGEKSNGKSYQVKHKKAIEHYLQTHNRFILLRRWGEDISSTWVEQYFSDVDVEKLTDNKYNCISVYKKAIYFSIYDNETMKTKRIEKIGYVMALSTEQHYSGGSFLDVDTIIFEEFMERGSYIKNEPAKLMIFYSTIDRKRGTTKLWLVGNTISKVCPYIQDWGLDSLFRKIKQGEILTKTFEDTDPPVTLAMEYCKSSGGKKLAIGSASSMIDSGSWQTEPQPHLPKSYKCYKVLYRIVFYYKNFKFIGEYIKDKESKDVCWFIYPKYSKIRDKTIVISDKINTSPYWQCDIYNMKFFNRKIRDLFDTFRQSNIFYSDDLTGTDFKQSIDFIIRK